MRASGIPIGFVLSAHFQSFVPDDATQRILIPRQRERNAFENFSEWHGGGSLFGAVGFCRRCYRRHFGFLVGAGVVGV